MLQALGFFALVEVVGLAAVPLAGLVFGRLPGAGLGFAKPLGLLLVTWAVWMAVSLGIVSYSTATVVGAAAVLAVAGALAAAPPARARRTPRRRPAAAGGRAAAPGGSPSARCPATIPRAGRCGWARRSSSRSPSR